ncbi:MAG: four helix bundle protein [Planctomycetota bacterium]
MQDFREMRVWQKAHALTLAIYRATSTFPREEQYGITSQVRRCAASIPANLAEGRSRQTDRDFARFVGIALGSTSETDYYLLLARDLGFLSTEIYDNLAREADEVRRMLITLHARLVSPTVKYKESG